MKCHFVDTRGLFCDAVSDFQDGVHPIVENNNKIAGAVWKKMPGAVRRAVALGCALSLSA